jgi:hypothetical protein
MRSTSLRFSFPLTLLFFALILFVSCKNAGFHLKGTAYQCPDGKTVFNLTECNVTQPSEKNTTLTRPLNLTNATAGMQNATTIRNFTTLRKKNTTEESVNHTNNYINGTYSNLNGWSVQQIVEGMMQYNEQFSGLVMAGVAYDKKDPQYYMLGNNEQAKIYDPFWPARSPYAGDTKEYGKNYFRVMLSQTPLQFLDEVNGKHNDTKFKILYPDQWIEWNEINCTQINSCRNIEAIRCERGNHTLWMWTHNTPGPGYTDATKYNMQAFDDDRETLDTFEKFYCTPV